MIEYTLKGYQDQFKLIHPQKFNPSENGILFCAVYYLLKYLNGTLTQADKDDISLAITWTVVVPWKRFQANPPQNGPHFSIDNLTGLYICFWLVGNIEGMRKLPIFKWNNKKIKDVARPGQAFNLKAWLRYFYYRKKDPNGIWIHPNGWAVFLSLKYWPLRLILAPLIILIASWSLFLGRKESTTGVQLWLLRLVAIGSYGWLLKLADLKWRPKLKQSLYRWSLEFYWTMGGIYNNHDHDFFNQMGHWQENYK